MAEPHGPLQSAGFWLHHAALAWRRQLDIELDPLSLTHTQFDLLASTNWLARNGALPTQQQVADLAGADRMMASKVLTGLEQRGLVTRHDHPGDSRAKLLRTTPLGHDLVMRAVRIVAGIDETMFGDHNKRYRLREQLRTIAQTPAGSTSR